MCGMIDIVGEDHGCYINETWKKEMFYEKAREIFPELCFDCREKNPKRDRKRELEREVLLEANDNKR